MKRIAYAALVTVAALGLAACGKSEDASEQATAESVEVPADEAVGDASAMPSEDAGAAASAAASDVPATTAAEAATSDAESKM